MANRTTNNAIVIFITMMFTTTSHISNIILPSSSGNIQGRTGIVVEVAVSTKQTVVLRATPPVDWDEELTDSSSSYNKRNHQRRIRRGGGAASAAAAASATASASSSESLVTGDLPPLSPEQLEALETFEEDNELGRQLLKDKKSADERYPLFGYGSPKKGPKGSKKHYGGFGGGLFGPGPKASKKFFKKHNKKGYYGSGGFFNNNGLYGAGPAAAAYGPNSYGYGYNRPGVNLGAILGPIIGIAVVACIAAKFCCLW